MLRGQAAEHVPHVGAQVRVAGRRDLGQLRWDGASALADDPDCLPDCLPDGDRPRPAEDSRRLAELAGVTEDRDQRLLHRIGAILQGDGAAQPTQERDQCVHQLALGHPVPALRRPDQPRDQSLGLLPLPPLWPPPCAPLAKSRRAAVATRSGRSASASSKPSDTRHPRTRRLTPRRSQARVRCRAPS